MMKNIVLKIIEDILWFTLIFPAFLILGLEKVLLGNFIYPIRFSDNIQQFLDVINNGVSKTPREERVKVLVSLIISMMPEFTIIGLIIWLIMIL